jgi:hypothetical protein
MAKKITGRIQALDSKYTGEENRQQEWAASSLRWEPAKFYAEQSRMFKFYGYYCDSEQLKENDLIPWMKANGYSEDDVDFIESAPHYIPCNTASKLARMLNLGMPDKHPKADEYFASKTFGSVAPPLTASEFIREELSKALSENRQTYKKNEVDPEAPQTDVLNVQDKIAEKVNKAIILPLDAMLDDWIRAGADKPISKLNVHSMLLEQNIPAVGCKSIFKWLDHQIDDLQGALDKRSEEHSVGYSYLPAKEIRRRVELLNEMRSDVDAFVGHKKATRKARVKKEKPAQKQVERMKFLSSSAEFKVTSVPPVTIPGSHKLYTFNVKYRILSVYSSQSEKGLQVKGTTVINYDEASAIAYKLRKPELTLPIVTGKSDKQVEKALTELTTKPIKPNGRINSDTIILRVIDTK